ncbi:YdbL family protein [Sphingomonas colocasiae]|uniref:YdbL family protein n=1 Tax=Sphingomonas colocasiae TaxID=1848973 RepID=A0ABS7PN55_9SPHN|nr:YdbL family protein [Sphingomonas colocasiae]MBY8822703.1 YdbL family protein [Sphingomonas colocasiae]
MKRITLIGLGLSIALAAAAGTAYAQRDPAYEAARAAGKVGEKVDGYLGVVGGQGADIEALVRDINIKRKAAYTAKAGSTGSTIEQFAFTTGCNLIANTKPGEKYQAPDGSWQTRGGGAPQRDGRCV